MLMLALTETNVNAEIVNAWLQHDLMPKLPSGAVLVMDNAMFHRRQNIKTMTPQARHILEYLPPY